MRNDSITREKGLQIVEAAWQNSHIYRGYGWMTILHLSLSKTIDNLYRPTPAFIRGVVCSAFCVKAVSSIGVDLGKGKEYRLVTPAHLSSSDLLTDVGLNRIEPKELEQF